MSKAHIASRTHWTRKVFTSLALGVFLFAIHAPSALASSWSPTLLVNTESFQVIDDGDGTTDIELRFGTSGKEIKFNVGTGKVELDTGLDVTGDVTATGTLSGASLKVSGDATVGGNTTLGGSLTVGGVTYTFPGADGSSDNVLTTDGAGALTWSDALLETELDTEAELEAQLTDVGNVIIEEEINTEAEFEAIVGVDYLKGIDVDTQAELEALLTDATNLIDISEIDTEAELEAIANVDFLVEADFDTQAELEAIVSDATNLIDIGEIDTQAKLEGLLTDATNVIDIAEINSEAKIEGIVGIDFIKNADIDTEAEFEGVVGVDYLKGIDVDTQGELEALLTDATNVIDVSEIDSQAELEAIIADATNLIDISEIDTEAELEAIANVDFLVEADFDTQAELEAILTDATNLIDIAEIDSQADLEGLLADATNVIDVAEIDTQAEIEALISDATNLLDIAEVDSEAELEAIVGVDYLKGIEIDTEAELEAYLTGVTNILTDNDDTDSLTEGATNLYFTDERADDAIGGLLVGGDGITLAYDDNADTLTITADALADSPDNVGLSPEYKGSTYYGDGTSNVGQLVLDYDTANGESFYKWTSSKGTAQDYNIAVRVRVPENFSAWNSSPLSFSYRTGAASSATNNLTVTMLDTAGSAVTLTGAASLASTSWATANITGPEASGTYTAGEYITLIIQMTTTNAGEAHAGFLSINWNTTNP